MKDCIQKKLIHIPPLPKNIHPDHVKLLWSYLIRSEEEKNGLNDYIKKVCDDTDPSDFLDLIHYADEQGINEFVDGIQQIIIDCMIRSCHLAVCLYYALYIRHDSLAAFKERSLEEGVAGPLYPYMEAMAEWMENMQQMIEDEKKENI